METIYYEKKLDKLTISQKRLIDQNTVLFDIETTGLSAKKSFIYLIGCIRIFEPETNHPRMTRTLFFGEGKSDECKLLKAFLNYLSDIPDASLLSFNGISFDIRYLKEKCSSLNIDSTLLDLPHIDLFKVLYRYRDLFGLPDRKQKTFETYLNTGRQDPYNGGELIGFYHQYLESHDESLKKDLLLHNAEDIEGLLSICKLTGIDALFHGNFLVTECIHPDLKNETTPEINLILKLDEPFPRSITAVKEGLSLHLRDDRAVLNIRLLNDTLYHFYPDYKNYCYFPAEDCAYHQDVARFADKSHYKKATAKNAYMKKEGAYLPVYAPSDEFYFYKDASRKEAYMLYNSAVLTSADQQHAYCICALQQFL